MTDNTIEDLSRLRQIAEEGRTLPLLGGRNLILWGSVVMVAALLHFAVMKRILPWPPMSLAVIWPGLTIGAAILAATPWFNGRKRQQAVGLSNRIENSIWGYCSAFLGLTWISILAFVFLDLAQLGPMRFVLFVMIAPIAFGLYAVALGTTSVAASVPALKPYALIALAFVPITTVLAGTAWQFLTLAIGMVVVAILPGRLLMALESGQPNG
jgi:hypothetical protein